MLVVVIKRCLPAPTVAHHYHDGPIYVQLQSTENSVVKVKAEPEAVVVFNEASLYEVIAYAAYSLYHR